jgi:hypothetical protein
MAGIKECHKTCCFSPDFNKETGKKVNQKIQNNKLT